VHAGKAALHTKHSPLALTIDTHHWHSPLALTIGTHHWQWHVQFGSDIPLKYATVQDTSLASVGSQSYATLHAHAA